MMHDQNVWQAIWRKIERTAENCGRNFNEVSLLAVTKRFSSATIRWAYAQGQRRFGENYVQEAAEKQRELADLSDLSWVLIGSLQKNKARQAANLFDRIESLDSLALAEKLSAARDPARGPLEVLIQVNISEEPQKSGVAVAEALPLALAVAQLPNLSLRGFMAIAGVSDDQAELRRQFALLRSCRDQAQAAGLNVTELSMGMSADMEAAIAEGATEIRIGTALFGERQ